MPTSWPLSYRTFCDDAVLWAAGPLYYSRGRTWLVWRRGARAVTAGRLLPPRHDKGSDQRMQKHCVSTYFSGEYHIPREEAIYIAGQAITDFIRRSPALDVVLVLYKPGIYLMAKRILGWDDTHSYETSAK